MPAGRFFVVGVHASGATVELAPDDGRKLRTVLRARAGDRIEIVDSAAQSFAATLAFRGDDATALLGEPLAADGIEPGARIVLAQAIPKGQKMDYVVEKATELGVAAIVPVRSARVAGERTGERKRERWQRIVRAAAQQSGRTVVPPVQAEHDWAQLCATFGGYDVVLLAWELAPVQPLRDTFRGLDPAAGVLLVIGPEGGFSADEVQQAVAAGARAISLGRRILRTETAALAVVSALLFARGEL